MFTGTLRLARPRFKTEESRGHLYDLIPCFIPIDFQCHIAVNCKHMSSFMFVCITEQCIREGKLRAGKERWYKLI